MGSAKFSPFGKDSVYGVFTAGDGIGRYRGGTTAIPDESGELHAICGGGWMEDSVADLRFTFRDYGSKPRPDLGFRIARYAE